LAPSWERHANMIESSVMPKAIRAREPRGSRACPPEEQRG
jgi:hypothetical protein